jgi:hypothetical protein
MIRLGVTGLADFLPALFWVALRTFLVPRVFFGFFSFSRAMMI